MSVKDREQILGKKVKIEPVEPAKTSVDLDNSLEETILEASVSSTLRTDVLESFSTIAQNRESEYELIDTMAMDSTMAAALETYAEDIVQTNSNGEIFWIESKDAETAKYVSFLVKKLDLDKQAYKWAYMLTKYGDVYVRLVRQSELDNSLIFGKKDKGKEKLQEDVNIVVNDKNDHYADLLDTVRNPGEMFELVKFGKTIGYTKAPVNVQKDFRSNNDINSLVTYRIKRNDVTIYGATEFAHACLESSQTRADEDIDIFMNDDDYESDIHSETFNVRRGAGIFNDLFKVWRQLSLMENSILLSRLTRSSITRLLQMEIGDMPKSKVQQVTNNIRSLLEHKNAFEVNSKMSEYINPGPVENIVILPTRNGKGAINMASLGGDYDPKQLTDLSWFNNKLFGGLKIPKQFLGFTDDNTGFNGGTSLTILNSGYGKAIIKMQKVLCQMVTDILNFTLIDKGYKRMINNFRVCMQKPVTQEDIDKKSDLSNELRNVSDIMNTLGDMDDNISKMKILNSLLSKVVADQDITNIIQEYIDKLESKEEKEGDKSEDNNTPLGSESAMGASGGLEPIGGESFGDLGEEEESSFSPLESAPSAQEELPEESGVEETPSEEDNTLPSPEELGVDLTQNPQR